MAPKHRAKMKYRKVAPVERKTSPQVSQATASTPARSPSNAPFARGQGAVVPPGFYNYVTRDLRMIGIVAGAMFVVLIILSLFL